MRVKKQVNSQKGFTLVELLIATTIFSFILLMVSSGIIKIGQLYYKGLTQNRTHEAARVITEEVTRSIQFAKGAKVTVTELADSGMFCVGDTRYVYTLNQKVDTANNKHALIAQRLNGEACSMSPPSDPGRELLSNNMRLLDFSVEPQDYDGSRSFKLVTRVAYGDNDLLTHYADDAIDGSAPIGPYSGAQCKTGLAGSNFCATAQLDTTVKKRLN